MSRLLRPGSALWLVRWDMMHAMRTFGNGRRGGMLLPTWLGYVMRIVMLVLAHALPVLIFWISGRSTKTPDANDVLVLQHMLAVLGQIMLGSMTLMSLYTVVNQLSSRQTLDLQLSSPLPFATLSRSRQYHVAFSSLIGFPLLAVPFANVGPFFGQWQMLWLYPTLIGEALVASALGLTLAGGLIRLFGPAKVKRYVNWLAMIIAMSSGFAFQLMVPHKHDAAVGALSAYGQFWAGSVSGAWAPSLALLVCGLLLTPFVNRLVGALYLEATNAAEVRRAKPVELRFAGRLPWVILRQQWRLMLRNPMIASNLISPLSMMIFPFVMGHDDPAKASETGYHFLIGMLGFAAPMTAYSLCWAATALDEAPGLMFGAPRDRGALWRWQLLAGLLPTWLVLLPPLTMVAWHWPLKAVALAVLCLAASISSAILARSRYRPVSRTEAKVQHGYRPGELLALMAYAGLWGGVAASVNGFGLGLVCLPFALIIPAWMLMRTEDREYLYE